MAAGGICGLMQDEYDDDDYDQETDYDAFIDGLQKCVADDDAIIIFESGNEKLRYLVGQAEVITTDDYCVCNIQATACGLASEMMNNPTWKTRCAY